MTTHLIRERYETLDVVGRGGESEVVRALDHVHDRYVALKVRPVSDEASRTELLTEARLLLSLTPHPGLPLVREDFFEGERYVIAMDWIEGRDLETVLEHEGRPGLDPEVVIDYLEQAADALEHLRMHVPPVVHGDVKPANLIVASTGRVVLVDFGLSSIPTDHLRRAGTAGYVAPEVAAGARPTAASDVYSFAATALTLLTGRAPDDGVLDWGAIEPARTPALERILRPSLAIDPAHRDASASALVARLRRWWGAELPAGTVTLVLVDPGPLSMREAEDTVDEIAGAHGGHVVSPAEEGPLLVAFASARAALDGAHAVAAQVGSAVAVVTGEMQPRAGTYEGSPVSAARVLLALAGGEQVMLDERTAAAVKEQLPRDMGLAQVSEGPTGERAWALVAPDLSLPPHAESSPYRGLLAFEPADGDLFFRREELVSSMVGDLRRSPFLAVVGASGSGKSSLVRAGLVPALADEGRCVVMTPGHDPVAALEDVRGGEPTLLIVDQLEEAFTLCPDEVARARFLDALIDLSESGTTSVVTVIRADFYGRCAEHARLGAAIAAHQRLLGPMQADELRRAIEHPALAGGLRFEAGLVDAMLADVEGEPGALPLLSHALYESWVRREGRVLTLAGYRAAGGVRGAIAHTADEVFEGCSSQEQALMRRMLLQLTELGESTDDTRRRVPLAELIPEGEGAEAGAVLEQLARSRLLVVGDGSAEIAHEALIREWPRLRGWLAEDRDELRTRRQLTTAARSWDEGGRDDADLYRGARLDAALERVDEHRQLSRIEREFLEAGQDSQQRELSTAQRRARRLRVLLAAVVAALVVALVAGSFALIQRGSARHTATVAQAGRLAAQSREFAAQHPDLALLLALEAGNLDDSVDTRGALLGALEHGSRIRAWLQDFDSPVVATAFNPSGTLLAAATIEGTTLYDTRSWKPVGEPLRSAQGGSSGVDFSPDGRTLAIAGGEGRVELWDVATRKERRRLTDPAAVAHGEPALATVRYSPDGSVIAAGGLEANHVTLWSATTGRLLGRPITTNPPGSGAHSISFSPDSKQIAVPGAPGTVGIWDVATGHRVGEPVTIGSADVGDTIFAEGGRTLIASDEEGAVSIVDLRAGRPTRPPLSVGGQVADSLDLSPDGRLLSVATFEGSVFVWNAKTGEPYGSPLSVDTSPVSEVAFSPDGRTLVSAHQRSAVVWDMSGRQALGEPLDAGIDLTTDVAFSPDGTRLVAGRYGGDVVAVDTATRRPTRVLDAGSIVTAVAFAPDGKRVAVGTIDGRVRLVDPTTGTTDRLPLDPPKAAVWQVAFSPDGRLLAVAVDPNGSGDAFYLQQRQGEVQLWDVASRSRIGRSIAPGAGTVFSLAFNRDGTLLATGSGGRLDLWDVATQAHHGTPMRVPDDGILSVAFDPSGSLVAGGGATGPARVWRVADQRPAFPPLTGHTGFITGAAFDPSATFLATTTHLGGTRLWDPATGLGYGDELVGSTRWLGPQAPSIDLPFLGLRNAFSPDGKLLAVSGVETLGMLWEVDPAVWRERACAIAGRNLSREEWNLHLPEGTTYRATCSEWPVG